MATGRLTWKTPGNAAFERFNTAMKPRYPDRYPILYGGEARHLWHQQYIPPSDRSRFPLFRLETQCVTGEEGSFDLVGSWTSAEDSSRQHIRAVGKISHYSVPFRENGIGGGITRLPGPSTEKCLVAHCTPEQAQQLGNTWLWLPDYSNMPPSMQKFRVWSNWTLHQYTGARMAGLHGILAKPRW
jgi:hypothetical protein